MSPSQNNTTIRALIGAMASHIEAMPAHQRGPLQHMIQTVIMLWDGNAPEAPPAKAATPVMKSDNYDPSWGYLKKFVYFLRKEQRFLHLREVGDLISAQEGLSDEETELLPSKISQAIGGLKKSGDLVKYQVGIANRNTFWGKKEWLEGQNKPKEQYKGNDKYLNTTSETKDGILDF